METEQIALQVAWPEFCQAHACVGSIVLSLNWGPVLWLHPGSLFFL